MLRRFGMMALAAAFGLGLAAAHAQTEKLEGVPCRHTGRREHAGPPGALRRVPAAAAKHLGIPVKLFPAADYAGVMQGIAAGQLEAAEFGASGFAGAWLDCKCIEPIVVPQEKDGSTYYYSVMVVRADSGIKSLEDMKGHSLAWADPNSTSGYLIPSATLKTKGINLDDGAYFSKTGFSGGHEQGVVAVLNKQYDAAVTWTSGQGEKSEGYTRGNLRSMVDQNMLKMSDITIIWQSGKISERSVGGADRAAGRAEEDVRRLHARPAEVASQHL